MLEMRVINDSGARTERRLAKPTLSAHEPQNQWVQKQVQTTNLKITNTIS